MEDLDNKVTVHIADDHQIIIDGLMAILGFESDIEVIGYSLDGSQLLDWFQEHSADVLLLDINMPKVSGIEVLEHFKKCQNGPHVIVLSSYTDVKLIKDVLELGAKGFLPKESAGKHIKYAIRNVTKGGQYFTEDVKDKMMSTMMNDPINDRENPDFAFINSLTSREYQILKLISQQYTTKKISKTLFISPSTVETHRKNLIKKLNVTNSIGLVIFAIKNKII
jgi:two-component system, NarL family, invasion response regulator UvrY